MESSSSHATASLSLSDNWSERVEDLVDAGDIDVAIALLKTLSVTNLRLSSTVLLELSKLYSAKGLSLKADALQSRAASIDVDDDLVSLSSRGGGGGLADEDAEAKVSGDVDRSKKGATGDSEGVDGVIGGFKINRYQDKSGCMLDARGHDRSTIASRSIEAYLIQTGFFHADPHPGNLAIDEDEAIIYYDFGMMGEIKTFTRMRLLDLFYAVYEKDAKKVMNSLIDLGAL